MPTVDLTDFGGGLWLPGDADSPSPQPGFAVPPNALLQADDVEYLPSGGVRGRRGRTHYAVAAGPGPIVGMFRAYPRIGVRQFGPLIPGAGASVAPGVQSWTTPNNIAAGLGGSSLYPHVILGATDTSQHLQATGFLFGGISPGATVVGIQVELYRASQPDRGVHDKNVRLLKGGVVVGEDKAARADGWPTTITMATYGSPSDLWGTTWTPAELLAGFGVDLVADTRGGAQIGFVETIRVTVWVTGDDASPSFVIASMTPTGLLYQLDDGAGTCNGIPPGPLAPATPRRVHSVGWPEKNRVYLFDGVGPMREFNPDSQALDITQITDTPSSAGQLPPRRGPHATLWKSRLWATEPTESTFSVYASEVNDAGNWQGDAQLSANDPAGGAITGLVGLGDRLLILKETSLFFFVGDILSGGQMVRYSERGCIAPETVAVTPRGVIFLARDGLYLTDGNDPEGQELSMPIRALFNDRGRVRTYQHAIGVYYQTKEQYWLKLDPSADDGYVLSRVVGIDGATRLAWAHLPVMPLNAAVVWRGMGDNGEFYVGDVSGVVRQADVGADDEGAPIVCTVITHATPFDRAHRQGRVFHVKPHVRGLAAIDGGLRYDGVVQDQLTFTTEGTPEPPPGIGVAAIPTYHWRRATITDTTQFGRSVAIRLRNPTDGPEFELHGITLDVALRTVRRW